MVEYKKNPETKHFYTFTCVGWMKKSKRDKLFLFYEKVEETLNNFPEDTDDVIEIIRDFLKNIYVLFWDKNSFETFLKAAVYMEEKSEELEKKVRPKLKAFIDFSRVKNEKIKSLNQLRINLRVLENMFWDVARILSNNNEDDGRLLVIPHFLNSASKYIFYYIVDNYSIETFYRGSEELEKLKELNVSKNKFEEYKRVYTSKRLSDYL